MDTPPARLGFDCETEKHRVQRAFFVPDVGLARSLGDFQGTFRLNPAALGAFLHMGFVPGTGTLFQGVACLPGGRRVTGTPNDWEVRNRFRYSDVVRPRRAPHSELVREGGEVLARCIERALAASGLPLVVPLSGGMDSRALLSGLLELVRPEEIRTYTYGVPGALDFEIGNRVARRAGTRHTTIDLTSYVLREDRLIETARRSDGNANVFHPVIWTEVIRRIGTDGVVWSGYTGDGVGGSFHQPERGDLDAAVRDFVAWEARFSEWTAPAQPLDSVQPWVARETKYDGILSRHEAVWFENHVERYTSHQIFMNGLRYAAPFMDDEFITFLFGAGGEHRAEKRLFNDLVVARYPRLFELPTRDYGYALAGGRVRHASWKAGQMLRKIGHRVSPRWCTHPGTSYLDYEQGLRTRPDVHQLVRKLLHELKRREVLDGSEIDRLWNEHQAGARHGYTLLILASLEITLRAFCD